MINILLVDDQFLTRQALRAIIKQDSNLAVAGEADNGITALNIMAQQHIDIALVDLDMPKMNGFEFTERAGHNFPSTKIVILSGNSDCESIERAINCGARGYLIKDTSIAEVIDTIHYVRRGYFQLGPGLLEKLISQSQNPRFQTLSQSAAKTSSQPDRDLLQQEIYQELSQELDTKITELKSEAKQGLVDFENHVIQQLKSGFEQHTPYSNNFQLPSQLRNYLKSYVQEQTRLIEQKFAKTTKKISQEIVLLRLCILFLLFFLVTEKILSLF